MPLQGLAGKGSGVIGDRATAAFELSLYLLETERGFTGTFEYNTDLFDRDTVERLGHHFQRVLEGMVADPDRRLSALSLLGEAERRLILSAWNETTRGIPTALVHEQVAAQAARTPEAVAVVSGGASLTYAQLRGRADRLARRLRASGVSSGALVAVCLERSPEMVVALHGILEAGGAYVPLDPEYPRERLALMLEDARPAAVLTEGSLLDRLPPGEWALVLTEDQGAGDGGGADEGSRRPGAAPDDLAYVVFTSGSTGRPKGVGITHRALVNVVASVREHTGFSGSDVLLAVTTLSFDIATRDPPARHRGASCSRAARSPGPWPSRPSSGQPGPP
jgi:non-ribosomal peptide synthetase component F